MSTSARLAIDGEMTIYRAAELKPLVLDALKDHATLELDLSGVTELDTAGLQILVLAKQAAQAAGSTLRLAGHSHAVLDVFELLDMGAYFGDAVLVTPAA
jgi:anti-sigma B factor antagonist